MNQSFYDFQEKPWPQTKCSSSTPRRDMEHRRGGAVCQLRITENRIHRWRLIRVTAHIRRLAEKICLRKHVQERLQGPLTPEELLQAELF